MTARTRPTLKHADGPQQDREDLDFSLSALLMIVVRQRRLVAWCVLAVLIPALILQLLKPATYTATASFRPQGRSSDAGGMSSIAAQFGLSLPAGGADPGESPAFYVELLHSRGVLNDLADSTYQSDAGRPSSLADLLGIPQSSNPLRRREAVVKRLSAAIGGGLSPRTGIVRVSVTTRSPKLAEQLSSNLLAELNRFNLQGRQFQAAAERQFVERRFGEVNGELRSAEDRLSEFMQQNRNYSNSPTLSFQRDRLAREVDLKQKVSTTLAQSYEQAKINEIRNTPLVTIIEKPELPLDQDPRGRIKAILFALLGGLLLGVAVAFWREHYSPVRA
jgi:uncharacterized protein involved in exopolysaccharide biosynthesis